MMAFETSYVLLFLMAALVFYSCGPLVKQVVKAHEFVILASNGHEVGFLDENGLSIGNIQLLSDQGLYVTSHNDRSLKSFLGPGCLRLKNPAEDASLGVNVENEKGRIGARLNISGLVLRKDGQEIYRVP